MLTLNPTTDVQNQIPVLLEAFLDAWLLEVFIDFKALWGRLRGFVCKDSF